MTPHCSCTMGWACTLMICNLVCLVKMTETEADAIEQFFKSKGVTDHVDCLKGDIDVFNGVTVRPKHLVDIADSDSFKKTLIQSLDMWQHEGKRGIWIKIPITQADFVPIAAKLGFEFHHAKKDFVMMTKWLPNEPTTLPNYAHHFVGVAGLVINEKNEVLVIQERYLVSLKKPIWKFPGGLADPGENLQETAIREVREETGIETEFVSLLCFRHMHEVRWGTDDLYFVCLLKPLSSEVKMDGKEISACKWIDLDTYISDPDTVSTNKMIAESYVKSCKYGVTYTPIHYPHFLKNKPDQVFYSLSPFGSCKGSKGKTIEEDTVNHKL